MGSLKIHRLYVDISSPVVRGNEPKAFVLVEPFYGACRLRSSQEAASFVSLENR